MACPIRNKEATTIAKVFVESVLEHWGLPEEILSDQGLEFSAEIFKALLDILGVVKLRTTAYKPSTNGCIERWHRSLNSMLGKVVAEHQRDWSRLLKHVTFCYNATVHSATGFSPFFIMTGRECRWNVDFLLGQPYDASNNVPAYTADTVERLRVADELVRKHLRQAADNASFWYNRKVNAKVFGEGDLVWAYSPRHYRGRTPKWQRYYSVQGEVVKRLNDVTYIVKSASWKQNKIMHVDKLKPVAIYNGTSHTDVNRV